ncbi:MAG: hypothetical protein AVDCRST_MAG59-1319 [uncultured Thermomicrobiales bacterium]|uniref:Uncharacterized protein n=1 Tax=uncultured Thermomicrobiales bacterium TaxID=1645740 RepID=A0A6J4UCD0_9BACT|nr:MAG: hypothetical protein AVDCRST_MAG59-1319 [uncultured Thermomicrobiales bacterium]
MADRGHRRLDGSAVQPVVDEAKAVRYTRGRLSFGMPYTNRRSSA